ncbi:hypothetical protein Molly5_124 [Maribacter phage Molly_5]|uniref:Uncharacterized protein n=2 Tax=Mollyvirus TaxID=2948826 RepID=A0A8E4UXU0_9CAUD|nr:hypothetical protein M1M29_gp123 [Maribacter phage Molly_1]YP_010357370.1 hypothetical protein M1M30_gp121 [Maribacter phage Colly_1]QQO97615.1 hypothetical protein Molly2_123 [Maribacter phage Molly_2]QQO97815.1 hypothetical protein Molly3_123 [Maribacter phage Molly_3]QQO98016.1 hypothetical protein Molly4_124 [Maribacter phage Molly_4]QQO98216.1 hypothetical protein Molly5_124 [Maribacter phage Molly_5]QQO97220.1 hypothetical protein Colly1_121 [Maribacter phage Colly_1]
MSDLLDKYKTRTVNYEYLNELWEAYSLDSGSEEFKLMLIPFCNLIATNLLRRFPQTIITKDELFSEAFYRAVRATTRKDSADFENASAFYSWLRITLDRGTAPLITYGDKVYDPSNNEDAPEVTKELDLRMSNEFEYNKEKIVKFFNKSVLLYSDNEKKLLLFLLKKYLEWEDLDEITDDFIKSHFHINVREIYIYRNLFFIIFKISCLMFLKEDFKLNTTPFRKIDNKIIVDKFFLMLVHMEKYPYLSQLYNILGDNFTDFVTIFGGCTVAIPSLEEITIANEDLDIYTEFLNSDRSDVHIKEVAVKFNKKMTDVRYILDLLDTKVERFYKDSYKK